MDQSYSESDISLSPSQILERLQVLRQLQLLQRGKLQKQRLEYQETSENSSSITEIVSHFSNSTSYNTFRSLLQSSYNSSNDNSPRLNNSNLSKKVEEKDLIEGVSVLNLSQESEFVLTSPVSSRSRVSVLSKNVSPSSQVNTNSEDKPIMKKHIALDEMPILSPKKDFETLVLEKLQVEKNTPKSKSSPNTGSKPIKQTKKPFLKRGEGMSRFGLRKKDLVIQNTKSLPWRKQNLVNKNIESPVSKQIKLLPKNKDRNMNIEIRVTDSPKLKNNCQSKDSERKENETENPPSEIDKSRGQTSSVASEKTQESSSKPLVPTIELPKGKHPLHTSKGKTWASVFTKEQNDFLRQLKQSDYYKNFVSPSKSTVSDASCDETLTKLKQDRELAEQNMFELLEHKVTNESFNMENSFFNKFLRRSQLEYSGESTPLVMQHCLANNPDLMLLHPEFKHRKRNDTVQSVETCNSEYTDCCGESCSSSCCSCKTMEETSIVHTEKNKKAKVTQKQHEKVSKCKEVDKKSNEAKDDTVNENDSLQVNMVEMNSKLIATSELLKERLRELEDEIETFRQENANLTKMREEIDAERHKFYEEKTMFEQKFNEEKILSEYYLAEEKEKMIKQKQTYEKYVREMRGRLNKKDKDEVINLKKEISDLKEEIRLKDAKSTSTIARLRNQLKLADKEKKDLEDQIEKLKKENRRIQHSNDMTRRMTNIKYLEEINKKLSNMTAKETQSEVILDSNAKYKTFEIERQSRTKRTQHNNINPPMRTRAKSVPNLKVTSRYAKYFSQRDAVSDLERNKTAYVESRTYTSPSDNDDVDDDEIMNIVKEYKEDSDVEGENNLEKIYMERFHSVSPRSLRSNISNQNSHYTNGPSSNPDAFFISKANTSSSRDSRSPCNNISPFNNSNNSHRSILSRSKSPISSHRSSDQISPRIMNDEINAVRDNSARNMANYSRNSSRHQSRSPVSILTNRSSSIQKPPTVIQKDQYRDQLSSVSPDPSNSKTSLTKTNLNPTEIKKPDGSRELRFPNGNVKFLSSDGKYSKFVYYNGDVKENFYSEGRIKYFYAETKTYHTTHADGLEVLEFPDGQVEKRYKDGSTEIRLPNGSVRYFDPKNEHVREEWRFPDGAALTVSASGEQRVVFSNGQVEVHAKDHKRREFPDGTVKLVYTDGTAETRYASGRVRIKDKHGNLIMDSAPA